MCAPLCLAGKHSRSCFPWLEHCAAVKAESITCICRVVSDTTDTGYRLLVLWSQTPPPPPRCGEVLPHGCQRDLAAGLRNALLPPFSCPSQSFRWPSVGWAVCPLKYRHWHIIYGTFVSPQVSFRFPFVALPPASLTLALQVCSPFLWTPWVL